MGRITTWYGNCTALNRKALLRMVRSAQRISGCLPSRTPIASDVIKAGTEKLKNSFSLKATRLLNSHH